MIEQVEAHAWRDWVAANDGVILDVREPFEWQQTGVLPDSKLISMSSLPASLAELDPAIAILVVCRSGNRSQVVAQWLETQGYRAANLAGGVVAVARAAERAS
jgi:rhodanese-related sulfurtransferase